ncbi:hypothetical protein [Alloactinosynnema sp. L-07]|nr:hypothetical protein [Alloactinosynnema sp. L-07]
MRVGVGDVSPHVDIRASENVQRWSRAARPRADSAFYDRPPHTEVYTLAFNRAQRAALKPTDSATMLDRISDDIQNLE